MFAQRMRQFLFKIVKAVYRRNQSVSKKNQGYNFLYLIASSILLWNNCSLLACSAKTHTEEAKLGALAKKYSILLHLMRKIYAWEEIQRDFVYYVKTDTLWTIIQMIA